MSFSECSYPDQINSGVCREATVLLWIPVGTETVFLTSLFPLHCPRSAWGGWMTDFSNCWKGNFVSVDLGWSWLEALETLKQRLSLLSTCPSDVSPGGPASLLFTGNPGKPLCSWLEGTIFAWFTFLSWLCLSSEICQVAGTICRAFRCYLKSQSPFLLQSYPCSQSGYPPAGFLAVIVQVSGVLCQLPGKRALNIHSRWVSLSRTPKSIAGSSCIEGPYWFVVLALCGTPCCIVNRTMWERSVNALGITSEWASDHVLMPYK